MSIEEQCCLTSLSPLVDSPEERSQSSTQPLDLRELPGSEVRGCMSRQGDVDVVHEEKSRWAHEEKSRWVEQGRKVLLEEAGAMTSVLYCWGKRGVGVLRDCDPASQRKTTRRMRNARRL